MSVDYTQQLFRMVPVEQAFFVCLITHSWKQYMRRASYPSKRQPVLSCMDHRLFLSSNDCICLLAGLLACLRACLLACWLLLKTKRHLFRAYPDRDERVGGCDRQALPLAEALLERGWQHDLPAEQHVFALMPLRHTPR